MHRFRKKSDAKKSQDSLPALQNSHLHLPELPEIDSLILPDLSRRFSLLRNSTGEPLVSLDQLRSRFAEKRAQGVENQISEEEEDILFETLGIIHEDKSQDMDSFRSRQSVNARNSPPTSPAPSSPNSPARSTKRYSNNMFGSGRFRDYSYRAAASKNGSSRSTISSMTPTEASRGPTTSYLERPSTPETLASSQSSPGQENLILAAGYQLSKSLGPAVLKRASLAWEEVMKEIEEEVEEQIVMPRTAPSPRSNSMHSDQHHSPEKTDYFETGTAISEMDVYDDSPRASPIPARTIPGYYIPGMPRPMTPRSALEFEEQRSHSTTPRARSSSPFGSVDNSHYSSQFAVRTAPYIPPLFSPRASQGRFTPEDSNYNDHDSYARRRPASPLSSTPYQPMAVSSRPSTPSNVTWTAPKQNGSHNRNASWISDNSEMFDHGKAGSRSLRSPPLPDSPTIDGGYAGLDAMLGENRPPSSMSGIDIGTSVFTPPAPQSPVPSSLPSSSSPTAGRTASRRSSRQNTSSTTPFTSGNSLVFSPIANSSHSSLDSLGSSYHSWDVQSNKDRTLALFAESDVPAATWHELSQSSTTPSTSPDDNWDAEDIIARYAGLNRTDFFVIQDKLVSAATSKNTPPEKNERAPSLRRRRPSTSQSNYSLNGRERIGSPAPQQPVSPTRAVFEQASANDLTSRTNKAANVDGDISPTRKDRDLAKALFGAEPEPVFHKPEQSDSDLYGTTAAPPVMTESRTIPEIQTPAAPYQLLRNLSTPKVPLSPSEQADLTKEVQRRAEAATLALRKDPSTTKLVESPPVHRKRITPHQISTPKLLSSSSSMETVPVRTGSLRLAPGSSTLGQRIKKLRGTLRTKNNVPTGEEVILDPLDLHSPPPVQMANYPANLNTPTISSAIEPGPFRIPLASPPASAGPGLKSFMARFRGKQRSSENTHAAEMDRQHLSPHEVQIPPSPSPQLLSPMISPRAHLSPHEVQIPPSPNPSQLLSPIMSSRAQSPPPSAPPVMRSQPVQNQGSSLIRSQSVKTQADDNEALKQLFAAASNLGLNKEALTEFVHRSNPSSSTKASEWSNLTRNNSTATASRPDTRESQYQDSMYAPSIPERRRSLDVATGSDDTIVRKLSIRKSGATPRNREPKTDNAVIRRTLIFASDMGGDLTAIARKGSMRRRRASAASVSSRSVQDRVPTPPPRSPTGKRFPFPDDGQPPLPPFPLSLSIQGDPGLSVPQGDGKPNSAAYDSLYDMYSEEGKGHSDLDGSARPEPEQGQAVEVIEMANGETIWSIVNGLRDSDSTYDRRSSFSSDVSRGVGSSDGVQVFFKEHGRAASKGSMSSFISRKKNNRPETKVFYSSSAKIGRLIEKLSSGMEGGSFNFQQSPATSSFYESTVEEQLQAMLGSLKTN